MNGIFAACPACGGGLHASQLSCSACDTVIQGRFALSVLTDCRQTVWDSRVLVRKRGNLMKWSANWGIVSRIAQVPQCHHR